MTQRIGGIIAALVLVFVAGASAGVAGDRLAFSRPGVRIRATVDDMSGVFDRLQLTREQRIRAESIAARTAPRTHAIMLETAERLRLVSDSLDAALRAILTPQQRARLDSLRTESRLLLKRKVLTPEGTRVDTLLDRSR